MYPARGRQRKVPLLLSNSSHLDLARFEVAVEVLFKSQVTHHDCENPAELSSPGGVGERRKGSGRRYDHSVSIRRQDKVLTYYSQWLQKLAPMVSLMVRT